MKAFQVLLLFFLFAEIPGAFSQDEETPLNTKNTAL